jgi:serine/threonine-protein kinase
VTVGLLLVGYLGAGFFMWRNVVLGRGDRRGAARLARVIALLVFGASLLSSSVAIDGRVFSVIQGAAAVALFAGAWCWAFYMAIEPFVRRQWPRLLVGWSRLMAGEWRDPQVGREVFIGALSATGTTVLVTAASWMSRTPGAEPPLNEQYYFRSLGGADLLTGGILQVLPWTMFVCLVMMVALLLARRVLRSDYAAIAVLAVVNVGTAPTDQWLVLAASLIGAVIGLVVALRVGFLAQVSSIAVWLIVTALPFAPSTPGFVGTLSWLPIAAVVIPSLFGLYTALAGQSIFGSEADHS